MVHQLLIFLFHTLFYYFGSNAKAILLTRDSSDHIFYLDILLYFSMSERLTVQWTPFEAADWLGP